MRRWWPPIKVWSSVALAIISPASSMMTFMRCLQCYAPSAQPRRCAISSNFPATPRVPSTKVADFVYHAPHRAARDLQCSSKGSFTLIEGTPELAIAKTRFASKIRPLLLGAEWRCSMGVAGSRFAHVKRTIRVRVALVGLLEELQFICPVVVAVGSTVMIVIKLCKDLPQ